MQSDASRSSEYGFIARSLHWVLFGLLAAQYIVGSAMPHIRKDTPDEGLIAWHMSIGSAILFFVVLRLAWRVSHPVPMVTTIPVWQQHLAHFTHIMLYVLIVAMTLLGFASTGYLGYTVTLFGIVPLPAIAAKGAAWGHTAGDIHDILLYVLLGFIVLHIGGALYHYFVARDRVLQRMLPAAP